MKLKFFGGSADDLSRPWMFKKDLLSDENGVFTINSEDANDLFVSIEEVIKAEHIPSLKWFRGDSDILKMLEYLIAGDNMKIKNAIVEGFMEYTVVGIYDKELLSKWKESLIHLDKCSDKDFLAKFIFSWKNLVPQSCWSKDLTDLFVSLKSIDNSFVLFAIKDLLSARGATDEVAKLNNKF